MCVTFRFSKEFRVGLLLQREAVGMAHELNYDVFPCGRRPGHTQNTLVGLYILFGQGTPQDPPERAEGKAYIV